LKEYFRKKRSESLKKLLKNVVQTYNSITDDISEEGFSEDETSKVKQKRTEY